MPKGKKVISKVVLENKSVNSHIPEEKFHQLMIRNMVTEMRENKKVLIKCDFNIKNFYIQNKKGTVNIWKIGGNAEYDKFKFCWRQINPPLYISRCCLPNGDNYTFEFKSFAEFDEQLKKLFICKYHVSCKDNCSDDYLVSPQEQCAICLNDVQLHLLEETQCGHNFCLSCLNTYVESKGGQRKIPCPTCRRNLKICNCCGKAKFKCEGFEDCGDSDNDENEE